MKEKKLSELLERDEFKRKLKADLAKSSVAKIAMGYASDELKLVMNKFSLNDECKIIINTKDRRTRKTTLQWLYNISEKDPDDYSNTVYVSDTPTIKGIVHSKIILLGQKLKGEPHWTTAYVGSANLTNGGLNNNHELIVRFTGQKDKFEHLDKIITKLTGARYSEPLSQIFIDRYDEESNQPNNDSPLHNTKRVEGNFIMMNTFNFDSFLSRQQFTITDNISGSDLAKSFLSKNHLSDKCEVRVYDKNEELLEKWRSGVTFKDNKTISRGKTIFRVISEEFLSIKPREWFEYKNKLEQYGKYLDNKSKKIRIAGRAGIQRNKLILELKILKK
jgi:hypothetical protein